VAIWAWVSHHYLPRSILGQASSAGIRLHGAFKTGRLPTECELSVSLCKKIWLSDTRACWARWELGAAQISAYSPHFTSSKCNELYSRKVPFEAAEIDMATWR
jgi:hypothetical protein